MIKKKIKLKKNKKHPASQKYLQFTHQVRFNAIKEMDLFIF